MQRREFLNLTAALYAAGRLPGGAWKGGIDRPGIQLWSVRQLFRNDPERTLAALAEAGFREVEFAGYAGRPAAEIRAMLKRTGLAAPSAHVELDDLRSHWPERLEYARSVGHEYLVLAWLPESERTLEHYRRHAAMMNEAAAAAGKAGLRFAYHNHDFEFTPADGGIPYDVLLKETDPGLVQFELDLFWIAYGGQDPLAYFAAWPGRFPLVHVKDMAPGKKMVNLGDGTIDFAGILGRHRTAGIRHYFAEHDEPADPMAFARGAAAFLKRLRI